MQPRSLEYQTPTDSSRPGLHTFGIAGLVAGCIAPVLAIMFAIGRWSDQDRLLWAVCPVTAACFEFILPSHAWPWTLGLIIGPFVEWVSLGVFLDWLRGRQRRRA